MKFRKTSVSMKVLAWVLAFVMMVPWNVLAEEGSKVPVNNETTASADGGEDSSAVSEIGGGNK